MTTTIKIPKPKAAARQRVTIGKEVWCLRMTAAGVEVKQLHSRSWWVTVPHKAIVEARPRVGQMPLI